MKEYDKGENDDKDGGEVNFTDSTAAVFGPYLSLHALRSFLSWSSSP